MCTGEASESHGKWIHKEKDSYCGDWEVGRCKKVYTSECGDCHKEVNGYVNYAFCPNCGVKKV